MLHLLWSMVLHCLLQDSLLLLLLLGSLLYLLLYHLVITPVPVDNVQVGVVVRDVQSMVIVNVMLVIVPVGSTVMAGPLVCCCSSVPTLQSCLFHIRVPLSWFLFTTWIKRYPGPENHIGSAHRRMNIMSISSLPKP